MSGRIIIRTDASTRIGSGHVMRCLTLAEELREVGAGVSFISRAHPGNLNELIREKGFQCHELPSAQEIEENPDDTRSEYASWSGVSQQQDAEETIQALGGDQADWLIVDHYGLDEAWEKLLRHHVSKIMVIDDLADRPHDCDLLLDQNFYNDGQKRYDHLVSPACTKLLGPKYALLRREFREARKNLMERTGEVKRVMVFFGGSDPDNITGLAVEALSAPELIDLKVDVVIGAQNPNRIAVEKLVKDRPGTMLHIQASNMAELMCEADLAIGAGGSTTWERCCMGLPSLIIPIAENQIPSTRDLSYLGVVMCIAKEVQCIKEALIQLLSEPYKLLEMSQIGIKMVSCDKYKDLIELISGYLKEIKLSHRKATIADCGLYWHWANDPEVRRNAFNSALISWEKHQEWFATKLSDPNSILLIFESQYGPVAQIRLEGDATRKTIGYSVARQYRGKGIGKKIISEAIAFRPAFTNSFIAEVKKENLASANIFERLGFQRTELQEKDAYSFILDLGDTYQAV
jgi:UDP-2,4-diacetamido-2,4,6-trideoxy-beta-L-altropyranose hydrolase